MSFRVVNTDNFGEKWMGEEYATQEEAEAVAEEWNKKWCRDDYAPRFAKVVEMPYELAPGFEP